MKQNKTLKTVLIFLIVLFTYFIAFKHIWGFNILSIMQWKMVFHYINMGVSLSPIFLLTAFSFPFAFATVYFVISGLMHEKKIVPNEARVAPIKRIENIEADSNKPTLVNGIDVGFIPEYKMQKEVSRESIQQQKLKDIINEEEHNTTIINLLVNSGFELLENPEIEDFRLNYFGVAERVLFCGAYFNNDGATINEVGYGNAPSWLKNGKIIESPMYKLSIIKNMFKKQAEEVLDGVEVDFVGVLFLAKTPENLSEINEKAKEYKVKIICLDNMPRDFASTIGLIEIKRNTDIYFAKFIQSVAHYLDPTFFYNADDNEDLNEE